MKFGSLFAGIGGLDLGLERAGMECAWQVEWNDYCQRVLAKHWPKVPRYRDIRELDVDSLERVDLVAGGFPCQPFSTAGHQRGVEDERWLWPEFARVLRVLRPRYALMENVPGIFGLGFDEVQTELAALGYDTDWDCVPAAFVGAPHQRHRVFVVAHADRKGQSVVTLDATTRRRLLDASMADTESRTRKRLLDSSVFRAPKPRERRSSRGPDDSRWEPEPDVGRVAHGVPSRVDRLRALGNAVVPQVAEHVGRLIVDFDAT